MSGHSKWHSIKHKKAKEDTKRGNLFGKLSKSIIIAIKDGNGVSDPKDNIALANAIAKAKENNMPQANIDRAIKRGTGEIEGETYESIVYEGYGPGGIAIIVEALTENRNRTASDLRNTFSKYGGNLGENGSVNWQFERKGLIIIEKDTVKDEEEFILEAIDHGVEDIEKVGDFFEVKVEPIDFIKVKESFETAGISIKNSETGLTPMSKIKISVEEGKKALKLINALEDHADIQHVSYNIDLSDEIFNAGNER